MHYKVYYYGLQKVSHNMQFTKIFHRSRFGTVNNEYPMMKIKLATDFAIQKDKYHLIFWQLCLTTYSKNVLNKQKNSKIVSIDIPTISPSCPPISPKRFSRAYGTRSFQYSTLTDL